MPAAQPPAAGSERWSLALLTACDEIQKKMSGWPKVAVIVLNWKGLADTCECLHALQTVTYPNYRIIVVDNGSGGDDVRVLQERFGDSVHIIENDRNYGFGGGCNIGMTYAFDWGVDYVLLLNNDTVVDPAFLSGLMRAAEQFPEAAAFCPRICHYHRPRLLRSTGGRVNPWTGMAWQVGHGRPDDGGYDSVEERDYVDHACMLIRRSALERVGLLDEDYFAYWEETDWCDRAWEAGMKSYYVPSARIWQKSAGSFTHPADRNFLFRRNAFLFLRKRKRAYHLVTATLFHLFVLAPLHLVRHPAALGRLITEGRVLLWHLTNRVRQR